MTGSKIETMLLGIAFILFGLVLNNILPDDEKVIIFIVSLIGFIVVIKSYSKKND